MGQQCSCRVLSAQRVSCKQGAEGKRKDAFVRHSHLSCCNVLSVHKAGSKLDVVAAMNCQEGAVKYNRTNLQHEMHHVPSIHITTCNDHVRVCKPNKYAKCQISTINYQISDITRISLVLLCCDVTQQYTNCTTHTQLTSSFFLQAGWSEVLCYPAALSAGMLHHVAGVCCPSLSPCHSPSGQALHLW